MSKRSFAFAELNSLCADIRGEDCAAHADKLLHKEELDHKTIGEVCTLSRSLGAATELMEKCNRELGLYKYQRFGDTFQCHKCSAYFPIRDVMRPFQSHEWCRGAPLCFECGSYASECPVCKKEVQAWTGGPRMYVIILQRHNKHMRIEIDADATIWQLKRRIQTATEISVEKQILCIQFHTFADDTKRLYECDIKSGNAINLEIVKRKVNKNKKK